MNDLYEALTAAQDAPADFDAAISDGQFERSQAAYAAYMTDIFQTLGLDMSHLHYFVSPLEPINDQTSTLSL